MLTPTDVSKRFVLVSFVPGVLVALASTSGVGAVLPGLPEAVASLGFVAICVVLGMLVSSSASFIESIVFDGTLCRAAPEFEATWWAYLQMRENPRVVANGYLRQHVAGLQFELSLAVAFVVDDFLLLVLRSPWAHLVSVVAPLLTAFVLWDAAKRAELLHMVRVRLLETTARAGTTQIREGDTPSIISKERGDLGPPLANIVSGSIVASLLMPSVAAIVEGLGLDPGGSCGWLLAVACVFISGLLVLLYLALRSDRSRTQRDTGTPNTAAKQDPEAA